MVDFKDPIAETYKEMEEKKRIINESSVSKGVKYNIYKANAETVRICKANENKTPRRWPDDHKSYIRKIFGIQ